MRWHQVNRARYTQECSQLEVDRHRQLRDVACHKAVKAHTVNLELTMLRLNKGVPYELYQE